MATLQNKTIAILADNGFEEEELTSPKKALEAEGATVHIVSLQKEFVKAWNHDHWSITIPVNVNLNSANSDNYYALMIPGGVINPDKMRISNEYVSFAREFLETGKPVAAICHGPQLLIETGMPSGRDVTSYPSIRTDLINAGANWYDKEVVTDNGLVTSSSLRDLPAFNKKMIAEFAESVHKSPSVSL
jgi:protease I